MQSETSLPIIVLPSPETPEESADQLAPLTFELQIDMPFTRVHDYFMAELRHIMLHCLQPKLIENLEEMTLSSLELNLIPTVEKVDLPAKTHLFFRSKITRTTGSLIFTQHSVTAQSTPPTSKIAQNLLHVRALWSIKRG